MSGTACEIGQQRSSEIIPPRAAYTCNDHSFIKMYIYNAHRSTHFCVMAKFAERKKMSCFRSTLSRFPSILFAYFGKVVRTHMSIIQTYNSIKNIYKFRNKKIDVNRYKNRYKLFLYFIWVSKILSLKKSDLSNAYFGEMCKFWHSWSKPFRHCQRILPNNQFLFVNIKHSPINPRYLHARQAVPGPIDPSCAKRKSFTFAWQLVRRATRVSFSFASVLERCLFTTRRRPTDLVRERATDSLQIHSASNKGMISSLSIIICFPVNTIVNTIYKK